MKQHHDHLGIDSTVITSAPIGICVTDAHGYFVMVNAAYCALYGYREEELIGQHFTVVVPEQARSGLSSLHDAFIAGDHQLEAENEWEVIRKDGARLHILANAARITGPDDQLRKVTYVEGIIDAHPQLSGRYSYRASLDLLPFEPDDNLYISITIRSLVEAIESIGNIKFVPKLYEEGYLAAIYVATGGNMRSIRQLFVEALSNAIRAKRCQIIDEDLIDAVDVLTLNYRLTDENSFHNEHKKNMLIISKKK